MKRSLWKFSRLFLVFALIIGGMVGVFSLIQYLSAASNANGAAANGVTQAQASSTELNQLSFSAQNNQIMAEEGASSTASTTVATTTTKIKPTVVASKLQTSQTQIKKQTVIPAKPQSPPQPQPQPKPQPQQANILGSFMSILDNFLSIQNEATNSAASSSATSAAVTASTTQTAPAESAPTPTPAPTPPAPAPTPTPAPTPAQSLALPYIVNSFSDLSGWQGIWGDVSVANGMLDMSATTSTTGAAALLADSGDWTNYVATVKLNWVKGQTFSLIARRQADSNVSCQFTDGGGISIKTNINGRGTLLGQGMEPGFTPTQPVTAWIQVNGDRVQCGLNAAVVRDYLYYGLPPALLTGGLSLNTWDPQLENAEIQVRSVDVEGL